MSYTDCMIDLETLGTKPGCVILSIGAVLFDLDTGEIGDTFYSPISKSSCLIHGLTIDPVTVEWWARRDNTDAYAVIADANSPCAPPLMCVLASFSEWLIMHSVSRADRRIWGNGAAFDQPILAEAYRLAGIQLPWVFWNEMCFRTIKNLRPDIPMEKSGVQHNALADAQQQTIHLIKLLTSGK